LDQVKKFRMDKQSAHDDLMDAVADLYQLRGRPSKDQDPLLNDETLQRVRWMQELQAKRPELDAMSLRVAWAHHLARQQDTARDEEQAMAGGTTFPSGRRRKDSPCDGS
jgi:hypothetical protein